MGRIGLVFAAAVAVLLPGQASSQSYRVYVAAESEDEVALLRYDAGGDLVVEKTITTGWLVAEIEAPHGLAVDPGGEYWYLTLGHGFPNGRVVQAPERWIYSAVLCFALDVADQERTGFRYHYSLFRAEYSRNLLFTSGQRMDRVFGALIDRVRGPLDLRTVKTLFGRRQRPRRHKGQPRAPVVEVSLETPEYDLTILRIRFRRLALKIYTKGERVLRIEAMAHNARDPGCRLGASYFPEAVEVLRQMVDRFIEVLDCLDTLSITKCEASSTPLASPLEPHPQLFHDA